MIVESVWITSVIVTNPNNENNLICIFAAPGSIRQIVELNNYMVV